MTLVRTFDLHIPELGHRKPIISTLDCPDQIQVAWHRTAKGVYELLDAEGHGPYGKPQESLWEVRTYHRTVVGQTGAYYEQIA